MDALVGVPFGGLWPGCRGPACRGDPWRPAGDDLAPRPAAACGSGGRRRDPGRGRRCQPATALPHADKEITATFARLGEKKKIQTQCTKNITTRLRRPTISFISLAPKQAQCFFTSTATQVLARARKKKKMKKKKKRNLL